MYGIFIIPFYFDASNEYIFSKHIYNDISIPK